MTDSFSSTRNEFPFLRYEIDDKPVTYLDNSSTTPKPQCVIDTVSEVYEKYVSNVHRGVHYIADEVTALYEDARREIASFINASPSEIVFTKNTTDAINLLASCMELKPDDDIVLTLAEHHSNYLPWRVRSQAVPVDINSEGLPKYEDVEKYITGKTRLLTLAQVPNTTGIIAPVKQWVESAHQAGLPILVDAAQSISHIPVDVRELDCDFLAFSGHKMFGPSGIGVLYGKREWLKQLPVYQTGGGMIRYHGTDRIEYEDIPGRFEAGTPNIEGAFGLKTAIRWLRRLNMEKVMSHSQKLGCRLIEGLRSIPGVHILADSAPLDRRIGLVTFHVAKPGFSSISIARLLCDRYQILVSGGYHCAHIMHHSLNLDGTIRISTQVFNSEEDVDRVISALRVVLK